MHVLSMEKEEEEHMYQEENHVKERASRKPINFQLQQLFRTGNVSYSSSQQIGRNVCTPHAFCCNNVRRIAKPLPTSRTQQRLCEEHWKSGTK